MIFDILVALKLMEAERTGFDKILEDYKDQEDSFRPFVSSYSDHFTLTLPDLTNNGFINKANIDFPYIEDVNEEYATQILSFCLTEPKKYRQIASHLLLSDSSYFRAKIIQPLINGGLLISRKNKGSTYLIANREKVKLR